jgi:hypothetical protein
MRRQIPSEKTKDVLDFATKRPRDRLESIKTGLAVSFIDYKSDLIDKSCRFWHTDNPIMSANLACMSILLHRSKFRLGF